MACQLILPDGCDSPPWQRERAGPPAARAPDFAIKTGTSINPSDTQNIHYGATRTAHPDASIAAHNGGAVRVDRLARRLQIVTGAFATRDVGGVSR